MLSSFTSMSTIWRRCGFVSGWKTTISSIRLRNSGLNDLFSSDITIVLHLAVLALGRILAEPERGVLVDHPRSRFEVMMTTLFLKSTFLPTLSVRYPSSSTCKSMLKISGWAFSISSKRTTEYGLRLIFSVS